MKPSFISLQESEGFTEDSFSEEKWIERTKDSGNSWNIEYENEKPFVVDGIATITFYSKKVKIKGKQYARPFTITPKWSGEGITVPVILKFTSST